MIFHIGRPAAAAGASAGQRGYDALGPAGRPDAGDVSREDSRETSPALGNKWGNRIGPQASGTGPTPGDHVRIGAWAPAAPAATRADFLGPLLPSPAPDVPPDLLPAHLARAENLKNIHAIARAHLGEMITSRKLARYVEMFGWEAAAAWSGLDVGQLMTVWYHYRRPRRRRWTTRDRARARAYIRHLEDQERQLEELHADPEQFIPGTRIRMEDL